MTELRPCPHCGAPLPADATTCPSCGRPASESAPAARPAAPSRTAASGDLDRRLERIRQWREAGEALGVDVPVIPRWVESRARREPEEGWAGLLERVEREAGHSIGSALSDWQKRLQLRIDRLQSFSVDSRLEREQIAEAIAAVGQGEIAHALASCRHAERVVALKERHLDQAREEIERVVGLLRDMAALGFTPPHDPARVSEQLEDELRRGRLAPMKQRLRSLRAEATQRILGGLPWFVQRYGSFLARQRAGGAKVDAAAAELARGTRAVFRGQPEEAMRRLRQLAQSHPIGGAAVPTD